MSRVVWTPVAEADLEEIIYYIALIDRRPATGEKIYFEIRERAEKHLARKEPGQRHAHAPKDWLFVRHKRWLIFYRLDPDGLEVMRVVDGARELPRNLRDD